MVQNYLWVPSLEFLIQLMIIRHGNIGYYEGDDPFSALVDQPCCWFDVNLDDHMRQSTMWSFFENQTPNPVWKRSLAYRIITVPKFVCCFIVDIFVFFLWPVSYFDKNMKETTDKYYCRKEIFPCFLGCWPSVGINSFGFIIRIKHIGLLLEYTVSICQSIFSGTCGNRCTQDTTICCCCSYITLGWDICSNCPR